MQEALPDLKVHCQETVALHAMISPLWLTVAERFEDTAAFEEILIVSSAEDIQHMKHFADYTYVQGGSSRQESLSQCTQNGKE